jgi:hypothetical protein
MAAASANHIADNTAARRNPVVRNWKRAKAKARNSGSFLYAAIANAGRANTDLLSRSVHQRANLPEVGVPAPPSRIVRVADHIAECRAFAAQLTLRHRSSHFAIELFNTERLSVADTGHNSVITPDSKKRGTRL